jgi:hypothetical protein
MRDSTVSTTKPPSTGALWENEQGVFMQISVFDIVGEFAVATQDGERIYSTIKDLLSGSDVIELLFARVRVFATPFFNASVGRLLKDDLSPEEFNRRIAFRDLGLVGREALIKVIENAKQYSDPAAREALDKILIEQSDEP